MSETTEDELHLAHFDDDKPFIKQRIDKIGTGLAWSEDPRSRLIYLVGAVQVDEADDDAGDYAVTSVLLLRRNRLEDEVDTWTALRHDRIRRTDDGFQLYRRRALLDQSVILSKNLGVFF